jgi:hypothetical protein
MNEETVVWGIHAEAGEGLHPWFDFLNKCEPLIGREAGGFSLTKTSPRN